MHLRRIEVDNILGLTHLEIDTDRPVILISGLNASGKSSLCDSVAMALNGDPRRVQYKKDYRELVHDGAKKGRVAVHDGAQLLGEFNLPAGVLVRRDDLTQHPGAEFLPLVLDAHAFADLKHDERRRLLLQLTRVKPSREYVLQEVTAAGANLELAEQVLPMLRNGFAAVARECTEACTLAKGQWQGLTGEKWGADKGASWRVTLPDGVQCPDEEQVLAKEDELAAANDGLDELHTERGRLQVLVQQRAELSQRRAELEDLAGGLERAENKARTDHEQLQIYRAQLEDLHRQANQGDKPTPANCPECGTRLLIIGNGTGLTLDRPVHAAPARILQKRIDELTQAVALLESTCMHDQQAIGRAIAAGEELQRLEDGSEGADSDALDEIERAIQGARLVRDRLAAEAEALLSLAEQFAAADSTDEQAAGLHSRILEWQALADLFGSEGIPSKLLARALKPVNDELKRLAGVAGWPVPALSTEMELTLGGRSYGLLSESERWRVTGLFSLVVAQLSGLRLALLDRFDVLETKARPMLIKLAASLAQDDRIDSLILAGTLKQRPEHLPPVVNLIWLEDGSAT